MTRTFRIATVVALCAAIAGCSAPKFKTDYDVAVTLTPAAVDKIKAANEPVVLDAYYSGAPTDATREKANEAGEIELGQDFVSFAAGSQTVHVKGDGLDQANLNKVAGSKVNVQLRAYSGTDNVNLLKCTTVTVALSDAQAKAPAISCEPA